MSGQHEAVKPPSRPSTPSTPAVAISLERESTPTLTQVPIASIVRDGTSLDKETRRASPAPFPEVRVVQPKSVPPFTAPKTTTHTTEETNREAKREVEREQAKIRMSGSFDKMVTTGFELNKTVKQLIRMNYLVMVTHFFLVIVMLYVVVHMSRDTSALMQEFRQIQQHSQHSHEEAASHVAR